MKKAVHTRSCLTCTFAVARNLNFWHSRLHDRQTVFTTFTHRRLQDVIDDHTVTLGASPRAYDGLFRP